MARLISWFEERGQGHQESGLRRARRTGRFADRRVTLAPLVVGFTGTGGAGKSSVVDELVRRFRLEFPDRAVGLVLMDPTRRRPEAPCLEIVSE